MVAHSAGSADGLLSSPARVEWAAMDDTATAVPGKVTAATRVGGDELMVLDTQGSRGGDVMVEEEAPARYRVYKIRWFGLAQLVLLNIVVSWDVGSTRPPHGVGRVCWCGGPRLTRSIWW